jgi:hypothetical protein
MMQFNDDRLETNPKEGVDHDEHGVDIKFAHVHLYVDHLCEVSEYKEFEDKLNLFQEKYDDATSVMTTNTEEEQQQQQQQRGYYSLDVNRGRELWELITHHQQNTNNDGHNTTAATVTATAPSSEFVSHGRDVVKQLIAGFGFRVTGCNGTSYTNTVVVTSKDAHGIQIVVTALKDDDRAVDGNDCKKYHHFDPSNIQRFYQAHSDRQGIAVLAFEVGNQCLDGIFHRYTEMHPKLLPNEFMNGPVEYKDEARVLEVFAYYKGEAGASQADEGTMLRFMEPIHTEEFESSNNDKRKKSSTSCKLPGIVPVDASFSHGHPAYFDHWVSNVISRTGFLDTLEDTLYFTPKVDFNAGVVAAGEAQIESTVTGNTSSLMVEDGSSVFSDQSQIYLPINNALTKVG